jgi:acetyltransferase-like isoleucine patch superfamily enzyme
MKSAIQFLKRCKMIWKSSGGILKSIYYNFRYLPLDEAVYLPLMFAKRVSVSGNGKWILGGYDDISKVKIYIGYKALNWMDKKAETVIYNAGMLVVRGNTIFIGSGSAIEIEEGATLTLRDGFNITGRATIICRDEIEFGSDTLISWDTLFMDSDAHMLRELNGASNFDNPIRIGNHVWIGSKCTVLPGTRIADHMVVGCNSLAKGVYDQSECVIGGIPAKIIKKDVKWDISKPGKEI